MCSILFKTLQYWPDQIRYQGDIWGYLGDVLGISGDILGRVAKCQIFYTDKNLSSNFSPKTRNLRLIRFRDKMRKSWSIQVVARFVCYVRRPIGYLHRIWVECKCGLNHLHPSYQAHCPVDQVDAPKKCHSRFLERKHNQSEFNCSLSGKKCCSLL